MNMHDRIPTTDIHGLQPGEKVVLAGWAQDVKALGKIAFIKLRDRAGVVQVAVPGSHKRFSDVEDVTPESVLLVSGEVQESKLKSGGNEVLLKDFEVLSAADPGVPIDVTGRTPAGLDTRLDNRYLDLRHPARLAVFTVRSRVNHAVREFLVGEGFIEMQTPKIISAGAEGGATLFPVQYYDRKAYLSQSQQLYKQMMLIAGFEKIFEIGPSFRAEKSHTGRHLTEFTQLDFEMAFIEDEDDVLTVLERMFVHVVTAVREDCADELELLGVTLDVPETPFPRIPYEEAVEMLEEAGLAVEEDGDIGTEAERKLGELVREKHAAEAYFLTKWPYAVKPFYIMTDDDTSRGFDFSYRGEELASGGQREHRHDVLCRQLEEKGLKVKDFDFYTTPFRYGAPPHGGFGMGVDRLVKKLLGLDNIREAVLFPRDPDRVVP